MMVAIAGTAADTPRMACEDARMKCAYRVGCGMALQNYLVGCSAVLQGPEPTHCPEICQHSLIALTSTEEGKELMRVGFKVAFVLCYECAQLYLSMSIYLMNLGVCKSASSFEVHEQVFRRKKLVALHYNLESAI